LLVAAVLELTDGPSDVVNDRPVRLVDFMDLDISTGMTETAFEETATALDRVRAQFAMHGVRAAELTESTGLHAFAAVRPAIGRRDEPASVGQGWRLSSQSPGEQAVVAPDGLVVVLGRTWAEGEASKPVLRSDYVRAPGSISWTEVVDSCFHLGRTQAARLAALEARRDGGSDDLAIEEVRRSWHHSARHPTTAWQQHVPLRVEGGWGALLSGYSRSGAQDRCTT
jgi:hypothetical protein